MRTGVPGEQARGDEAGDVGADSDNALDEGLMLVAAPWCGLFSLFCLEIDVTDERFSVKLGR